MTTTCAFAGMLLVAQAPRPRSPSAAEEWRKERRFIAASLLLRREIRGELLQLRLAVALGDLVHHGGGPAAVAEGTQLLQQDIGRHAGQRGHGRALHRTTVGAVAVGASGGEA